MPLSLWTHCDAATMLVGSAQPYGLVRDAALVTEGEVIRWIGSRSDLPSELQALCSAEHDCGGALLTPGLIDCHTHLVYGGDRAAEFEQRLQGVSYEEIARQGGGIASTVSATRGASAAELERSSATRLRALMAEGVTTIEIKSGYGLAMEHERKCLQVARNLARSHAIDVRTTFLGAHAVPPEFAEQSDAYVDNLLPMMQHLHAEQLSDSGGAQLAAGYGALSCDHLEWLSEQGAAAMAQSGTVAVLLPGAFYFLRETKLPPINLLRQHQVPMALSTDCNPGSSPCTSLLLMLNMACTLFRFTPEEALAGVTRHAALALGLKDRGVLAPGMRADFVLWDVKHPASLAYAMGANPMRTTVFKGQLR